jgi:hypothetical protein
MTDVAVPQSVVRKILRVALLAAVVLGTGYLVYELFF